MIREVSTVNARAIGAVHRERYMPCCFARTDDICTLVWKFSTCVMRDNMPRSITRGRVLPFVVLFPPLHSIPVPISLFIVHRLITFYDLFYSSIIPSFIRHLEALTVF
jgi:hypothetical protein